MKPVVFLSVWLFILLVSVYDGIFAWYYRVGFQDWELNPLALWIFQHAGMEIVLGCKALLMLFACCVAVYCHRRRHRLEIPLTIAITGLYVFLSLVYVADAADIETPAAEIGPEVAVRK